VGIYRDHVLPRILNTVMNTKETRRIRAQVCEGLAGEVVEIGFGTGHNLPFLPDEVKRLRAVDPMAKGRDLAAGRLAEARCEVEFVGLDGQRLPLPDASADAVLLTWTLCSIEDPVAAVREMRRVLRPGGEVHFVEHGLSPDARVQTWQHRCNGLERRLAGGCNLDRDIPALIENGGLAVRKLDTYYAKGDPKPWGWTFEGRAVAA
jgi:SAM-dependent methyltransferase